MTVLYKTFFFFINVCVHACVSFYPHLFDTYLKAGGVAADGVSVVDRAPGFICQWEGQVQITPCQVFGGRLADGLNPP